MGPAFLVLCDWLYIDNPGVSDKKNLCIRGYLSFELESEGDKIFGWNGVML